MNTNYNQYMGAIDNESRSFTAILDRESSGELISKKRESDNFKLTNLDGDVEKEIINLRQEYFITID